MTLLDSRGNPIDRANFARPREKPILGDRLGVWAGRDYQQIQLPGGSMLMFDLDKLTLSDFRMMRNHYQINASLSVLSFILHQIDWSIECENEEIRDMIEGNLRDQWTMLIRAMSQSFWAGFAPTAVIYENDVKSGYMVIDKFKDLPPEECEVNWKETRGWAPPGRIGPKIKNFDGIKQGILSRGFEGNSYNLINPLNSFWYPFMMENGDYYGKKLLKPAFPSYYFSQLIHLFANRYHERFGEPTPVGRAPFDDTVDYGGQALSGRDAMQLILQGIRNRSTIVLPSDRDPNTKTFDYEVEYLESQMRGADFERYMSRLDEEMSLAVFTPVLLFRTADVGSYNLGQAHLKIFLWMLNSVAGDMKLYIQHYLVDRLRDLNFGKSAPAASWVYRKLGKDDADIYRQMLMEIVRSGRAMPDLAELGTSVGLTLHEVEMMSDPATGKTFPNPDQPGFTQAPERKPEPDPNFPEAPKETGQAGPSRTRPGVKASAPREVINLAVSRAQAERDAGRQPAFGHRKPLARALQAYGHTPGVAVVLAEEIVDDLDALAPDLALAFPGDEFSVRLAALAEGMVEQRAS